MKYGDKLYKFDGHFWRNRVTIGYRFRMGPVPLIGKRRHGFYDWFKGPKTTQERKRFYMDKGLVRIRGDRTACGLPNAWDDSRRSDVDIKRSWKKRKKQKQWM